MNCTIILYYLFPTSGHNLIDTMMSFDVIIRVMLLNLLAKSNSTILFFKLTINCAKLILGILTGNVSVKKNKKNVKVVLKRCHI